MIVETVSKEADLKDPEEVYQALRGNDCYLLESADGGEKVARFSFIGFNPVAKLKIRKGKIDFESSEKGLKSLEYRADDPLESLRRLMTGMKSESGHESRFFGGFVGYFSYDLIRYFIELEEQKDELEEPDCEFVLSKNNIIFDHKKKTCHITQNEFSDYDEGESLRDLDSILRGLETKRLDEIEKRPLDISSNMDERYFKRMVRKTKDYIKDGHIIQAVLSQRFETDFSGDSFSVFRALKKINPSPYMYHLDFGGREIVGSSPEMLARVEKRKVLTYPIAGTRARGNDPAEDLRLEKELLRDKKERAEHLMLVDLGRNDIGRVADFGSVRVNKFMGIEKYSHVQHIVSEVEGLLKDGKDRFDALKSIFPAGTVSGAPKVRAMEIINELEPSRRGIYAGSVGYFSFSGNMDSAISIRTLVFEGGKAYMQAGAGIVSDSMPKKEYEETVNKAKGVLKALGGEIR